MNIDSKTRVSKAPNLEDNSTKFLAAEPEKKSSDKRNKNSHTDDEGNSNYYSSSSANLSNSSTKISDIQRKRKPSMHFSRISPPKKQLVSDQSSYRKSDNSTSTTVATTLTDISSVTPSTCREKTISGDKITPGRSKHVTRTGNTIDAVGGDTRTSAETPISSAKSFQETKAALAHNFYSQQRALALSKLKENSQMAMKEAGLLTTTPCVSISSKTACTTFKGNQQPKETRTRQGVPPTEQCKYNTMNQTPTGKIKTTNIPSKFSSQALRSQGESSPKPLDVATSNLAKRLLYEAHIRALKDTIHP